MSLACPRCRQPVRRQSRFCPQCGQRLEARLAPGDVLHHGDYVIVGPLHKGGMGEVYLAKDRRAFDRLCVIKQMLEYYDPADPAEQRRALERFQEEGRTLANLCHPGVPKIYAFFSTGGRFYIAMEYIQGENLEDYVTHIGEDGRPICTKRLPREEVVRYILQVCRILEYLHSQPRPVIHQDIKPANLILEREHGLVRLVDFGTVYVEPGQGDDENKGRRGVSYGTAGYAAPEQYQGRAVPRSDVYALAATAYHLLTDDDPREHPFKFPKLHTLPKDLAAALERALRPAPEQRSTAAELRQALEALSTPTRALEAFTFPGGTQIRSVSALPSLCDEHWDAARSFLYKGDFQRWLRDINRLDLVVAADEIVHRQPNHDAGLEEFLRVVDPGLPHPKIIVDPSTVPLGSIAREAALLRRVTVLNATRGYVRATVSASQPWLEVYPTVLNLWAGIPVDIRINVHAEGLPFRRQQHGTILIQPEGEPPVEIPLTAQVSLWREVWRLTWRALAAALPGSWRGLVGAWRIVARVARTIGRPFARHGWLAWLLWFLLSAGLGVGLYFLPPWAQGKAFLGWILQRPDTLRAWQGYLLPLVLAPPALLAGLWLSFVCLMLGGGAVWGALRGAWRSFLS